MKPHDPTRTPAAPACQPDCVRGFSFALPKKDPSCLTGSNFTCANGLGIGSGWISTMPGYQMPGVMLISARRMRMGVTLCSIGITAACAISYGMCSSLAGQSFTADGVYYRQQSVELPPEEMSNQAQLSLGWDFRDAMPSISQYRVKRNVSSFSALSTQLKPVLRIDGTSQYSFSESSLLGVVEDTTMDVAGSGRNAAACVSHFPKTDGAAA